MTGAHAGYQDRRREASDPTVKGYSTLHSTVLSVLSNAPRLSARYSRLPAALGLASTLVFPCGPKMRPWDVTAWLLPQRPLG